MKKYTEVSVGCDPEVFLEKPDGTFINAFNGLVSGIISGTKAIPEPTEYGAVQVDGMAVELNTHPTCDPMAFSSMILEGIKDVETRFGARVSKDSVKEFTTDYLFSQHPRATELGCDPDFDAWNNGDTNTPPNVQAPIRTAGGHVHIGWGTPQVDAFNPTHFDQCCAVIRQMDYVLGIWGLTIEGDKGARRRELYGRPGAFRPKLYGVEYRVLSNFWMFDKSLCETLVNRTVAGMRMLDDGLDLAELYGTSVCDIILNNATTHPIVNTVEEQVQNYM